MHVCVHVSNLAPAAVVLNTVDGQSDHLHVAFFELIADHSSTGQLSGAHWGEVPGVGEEDAPSAAEREAKTWGLKGGVIRDGNEEEVMKDKEERKIDGKGEEREQIVSVEEIPGQIVFDWSNR